MKISTWIRRSRIVSTQKKSHARIPRGLRVEELAPRWPVAAWGGVEAAAQQDAADGARRDTDAELGEFAGDPRIAPARVLPRESEDQVAGLRRDRWPARAAMGMTPALPNERRRRHDQASTTLRSE